METLYDWLTVGLFAVLAVTYLQRSSMPEPPDRVWHYIPPALSCAVANYLGNKGHEVVFVFIFVATLVYIFYFIKPFGWKR